MLKAEGKFWMTLRGVWIQIPLFAIDRELHCAYKRQTINPEDLELKFLNMSETTKKVVFDFMGHPYVEGLTFSCLFVSKFIVQRVNKRIKTYEHVLMSIVSLTVSMLPMFILLYDYDDFTVHEIVYMGMSAFYTYGFCSIFLKINLVGIYDFSRKMMLMAQCTSMISNVDAKYSYLDDHPLLDLEDIRTILSWYYMRNTFLDFGKRYTLRIFMNAS